MQPLEELIATWRSSLRRDLDADAIEELEEHLREAITREIALGKSETEAFEAARRQIGTGETIINEFGKVSFTNWWAVKVSLAIATVVMAIASLFAVRVLDRPLGGWLAPHILTITGGYLGIFLTGGLGMALVLERCFGAESLRRAQTAVKAAIVFSAVALILTLIGVALGMVWAKLAWGRFWAWDAKETGAFGILVWLGFFAIAARRKLLPPRAIMQLAVLGNVVVSLGWFAPNQSYGILLAMILLNATFLLLGFFPIRFFRRAGV